MNLKQEEANTKYGQAYTRWINSQNECLDIGRYYGDNQNTFTAATQAAYDAKMREADAEFQAGYAKLFGTTVYGAQDGFSDGGSSETAGENYYDIAWSSGNYYDAYSNFNDAKGYYALALLKSTDADDHFFNSQVKIVTAWSILRDNN
jgi:hypothetical protein